MHSWRATCIQMRSESAGGTADRAAAHAVIKSNLDRALEAVEATIGSEHSDLVLLPEYLFQGAPRGESIAEWSQKACSPVPGPLTEPLQDCARRLGVFIGGHQFEVDPDWPGRFFNTAFLIDRSGDVVLRYRRIATALYPSPHDVRTAYFARYGVDGTFPVVNTELGRLAMIICGEITVPEAARPFMLRGAEVLLHPTNEPLSLAQEAAKVARAAENMVYLVSTNVAGPIAFDTDGTVQGGRSQIIDFRGEIVASEPSAVEANVSAEIDIDALRSARASTGLDNTLLRLRLDMYLPAFADATLYPSDQFADSPMESAANLEPIISEARANLAARVVLPDVGVPTGASQ